MCELGIVKIATNTATCKLNYANATFHMVKIKGEEIKYHGPGKAAASKIRPGLKGFKRQIQPVFGFEFT